MSLRSFVSQLFLSRKANPNLLNHTSGNARQSKGWRHYIVQFLMVLTLVLSALWLLLLIGYQLGAYSPITWLSTIAVVALLASLLTIKYWPRLANRIVSKTTNKTINEKTINEKTTSRWLIRIYIAVWLVGLGWFFSIEPQQNRDWMAEVSQRVSYERDATNPNLITLTNVRNFDWYTDEEATERWETRTIDMSKLSGIDVSNSYWMGPLIAHTLVSFRFEDDRPLAFSFEIRKENGESFSALAGFFRRYELSLIASEERDIIYTRSNARGEQVYLLPVSHLQQSEVKSLFESYLTAADELNAKPAWYNTLTSNCTNIIFYMARIVSGERLPWDYRIWVSGWLPNYLYDVGMLDANPENGGQPWSMDMWYERAHINPKVRGFDNKVNLDTSSNSNEFSAQIRQGIPIPPLADSQLEADAEAKSAAQASSD